MTYSFLGDSILVNGTVNLTDIVVAPTQTAVTAQAGPMQVNLTFLNPIEVCSHPSVCFKHRHTSIQSQGIGSGNPSRSHTSLSPQNPWMVQLMLCNCIQMSTGVRKSFFRSQSWLFNLVAEWSSGDRSQMVTWNTVSNSDVIYHSIRLQKLAVFNEVNDRAQWGNLYYAIKPVSNSYLGFFRPSQSMTQGDNVTYNIAGHSVPRSMFQLQGVLDNQEVTGPLAIDVEDPVFALSTDLGTIQATQSPVVWTVGHITDPAISYTDTSGVTTQRSLYYKSQYSDDGTLVSGGISSGDYVFKFTNRSLTS